MYFNELNGGSRFSPITDFCSLKTSSIIVARDQKDQKFYRARVLGSSCNQQNGNFKCTVQFIDFGHTQLCTVDDLFEIDTESEQMTVPARCFQCCLAKIQPSKINVRSGKFFSQFSVKTHIYSVIILFAGSLWDYDANQLFRNLAVEHRSNTKIKVKQHFINWKIIIWLKHFFLFCLDLFGGEWRCTCFRSFWQQNTEQGIVRSRLW